MDEIVLKEFIPAVMVNDRLSDNGSEGQTCVSPARAAPVHRAAGESRCRICFAIRIARSVFGGSVSGRCPRSGPLVIVRNVIEYLGASTAGMLCSHICRDAPVIM